MTKPVEPDSRYKWFQNVHIDKRVAREKNKYTLSLIQFLNGEFTIFLLYISMAAPTSKVWIQSIYLFGVYILVLFVQNAPPP